MAESFGQYFATHMTAFNFAGCSEEEIEQVRIDQQVDFLPEVYRQFLLYMGYECPLFVGEDVTYSSFQSVQYLKIGFKDLVREHVEWFGSSFSVPDDAFVFMGHHGIAFWYFHTSDKQEDPPVYVWGEGSPSDENDKPTMTHEHLSEFFEESVRERFPLAYINYKRQLSPNE